MKIDGNNDGFEGSPLKVCENCKHWTDNRPHGCKLGQCDHPKLIWRHEATPDCAQPSYDDSLIHTGPQFGCIQWESKE